MYTRNSQHTPRIVISRICNKNDLSILLKYIHPLHMQIFQALYSYRGVSLVLRPLPDLFRTAVRENLGVACARG